MLAGKSLLNIREERACLDGLARLAVGIGKRGEQRHIVTILSTHLLQLVNRVACFATGGVNLRQIVARRHEIRIKLKRALKLLRCFRKSAREVKHSSERGCRGRRLRIKTANLL